MLTWRLDRQMRERTRDGDWSGCQCWLGYLCCALFSLHLLRCGASICLTASR